MSAGELVALISAITALVTALGTLFAQIGHLAWHRAQQQQPQIPPAPAGRGTILP